MIHQRLALKPSSQSFPQWRDIPVPVYERFYFFNITNPVEIERFGAKPKLKEIGPFTYRLYLNKTAIKFNKNGTVSYRERKTWRFIRSKSIASENQIITTLNGPLALTLTLIQSAQSAVRVIVNLALEAVTEGFFIKRSVKQLLFEGYPDILTTFAPLLNPEITSYSSGRFAWLIGKNGTDEGMFTVHDGTSDIERFNIIDTFQNRTALPYWLTDECNSFDGATNGEFRPPLKNSTTRVKLFHPDLCRILELDYNNTYEPDLGEGIKANRFVLSPNTWKNAVEYPPNSCYDTKLVRPTPVTPQSRIQSILNFRRNLSPVAQAQAIKFASGVFDISKCKFGMPILISPPHFYGSDPYFRSVIDGLKPNESRHNFWMDVEPSTGTTVSLAARVQVNVAINKGPGFRYRNVPNIVFPIFWQEMTTELNHEVADELWLASHMPQILADVSSYSFYSLGSILLLSSLVILAMKFIKSCTSHSTVDKSLSNTPSQVSCFESCLMLIITPCS